MLQKFSCIERHPCVDPNKGFVCQGDVCSVVRAFEVSVVIPVYLRACVHANPILVSSWPIDLTNPIETHRLSRIFLNSSSVISRILTLSNVDVVTSLVWRGKVNNNETGLVDVGSKRNEKKLYAVCGALGWIFHRWQAVFCCCFCC